MTSLNLSDFGNTGFQVSRMGLGLAALGRPGYINLGHSDDLGGNYGLEQMERQSHRMLSAAWKAGIRYFDAAQSYGKAEEFLSSWLKRTQLARDKVIVGSKWGYIYTADWKIDAEVHERKEHSLPVLDKQWIESHDRLGDYLRLYQIHSATFESGVLDNVEVLNKLASLKQEGICIGLSLSGPQQAEVLRKAMNIEIDGLALFDSVQATWNLLERTAGEALNEAADKGMGVIIKEGLANGRLTARNNKPEFAKQFQILNEIASQLNNTIDALALAGVLARPWVHVVLSGAAIENHLLSNLKALEIDWSDEIESALSSLTEEADEYWKIRKHLSWN